MTSPHRWFRLLPHTAVLAAFLAVPLAAAAPSGVLSIAVATETSSLDPAVNYDAAGTIYLAAVYDGLVKAVGATTVQIVPNVATSWTTSKDGKTWTFQLRPGVKFHDGSPLNAAAVKFSFDRFLGAKRGAAADFEAVSKVEVAGPLSVRFVLKYPFSSFLNSLTSLSGPMIVSPKTVGNDKITASGDSILNKIDAGSGPYTLASYVRGQRLTLKAFPGYWGGWAGSHSETVNITWPASSSTQRLELEQGEVDAAMNLSVQDFDAVAHNPAFKVVQNTSQLIHDIRINTTREPLKDARVRQALSYAFNYDGVVKGVYRGYATRMLGIAPNGFKNYVEASRPYTYDLVKAKALLAQAGYAGKPLNLTIGYLPEETQQLQVAQIFQADLAKIGVTARLQGMPLSTYFKLIDSPQTSPDLFMGSWTMDYNDNAQLYTTFYTSSNTPPAGGNYSFYNDPATDKALALAARSVDEKTTFALYKQIADRVYAAAPQIWTVQPIDRVALSSKIKGYSYNALYGVNYFPVYDMSK